MTRIAFLGLGRMGTPMATRLLSAGHELVVWNRTAARAEALAEDGAKAAATPAEAVRDADVVITMLADPAAVADVTDQIAGALRPGTIWVDMSSIGPDAVKTLRTRLPEIVQLIDAPVMGSVDAAASGKLVILAGGDVEPVEALLAELGTVRACGPVGSGSALKVVLISAAVAGVALVGEALALADALGVPNAREALAAGPLAGVVGRAFSTTADFPIALAAKDLGLAAEALDLPMLAAARGVLLGADDQAADLGAVVGHIRRVAEEASAAGKASAEA